MGGSEASGVNRVYPGEKRSFQHSVSQSVSNLVTAQHITNQA
jgi:hypothetical protein